MKKEVLIRQIASEFNVDEVLVSEYFENIFETLAAAFIKNKNVNISEFGKFRVKTKKVEDGEKQKTVQFSPVKKFADDINYNFSDLLPVQIRLMDSASLKAAEDYEDYEAEEILLIDFEEEKPVIKQETEEEKTEILIHEEEAERDIPIVEKPKEEILIPEKTKPEIPTLEEEKEKEILITEKEEREILTGDIKEETAEEKEPVKVNLDPEKERIIGELSKIKFPVKIFSYVARESKPKEILSAAKNITHETTLYIKEEKPAEIAGEKETDEIKPQAIIQVDTKEEERIEDEIEKLKAYITGEEGDLIAEEPVEEIAEEKHQNIFEEETKETEPEEQIIENKTEETEAEIPEVKDEAAPKTSLELEFELLQMLEERKKILEEISRLENTGGDDLVDISGPKQNGDDDKPRLHDESTIDKPKQNIFVDDEGKVLEDLLNLISGSDIKKTEVPEDEIINEKKDEELPEIKDEIEINETEKQDEVSKPDNGILNTDELFENIYGKEEETQKTVNPFDTDPGVTNSELKVFDRLLDDAGTTSEEISSVKEEKGIEETELTSFSDLEKMFKSFKTEISEPEPVQSGRTEEIKTVDEDVKTETIKTYDDISNLIGTNGEKKEEKIESAPAPSSEQTKKMSSRLKQLIIFGSLLVLILLFVFFYKKLVYQPSEPPKQLPVTAPVDSVKTERSDSVIFADTNKTAEKEESEIVFEKDDKVIKETPKGFFIEFGEYENQFELAKEIKALKERGVAPGYEEVKSEGKTYYKMKLGPYNSLKEAKMVLPKL